MQSACVCATIPNVKQNKQSEGKTSEGKMLKLLHGNNNKQRDKAKEWNNFTDWGVDEKCYFQMHTHS